MTALLRFLALWMSVLVLALPVRASPVVSMQAHPGVLGTAPSNIYLDITISGLQSGGFDALLGGFDLTMTYDPALVQLLINGPSQLGSALGDPVDPTQTFVGGDNSTPGVFSFFEVSLLEASSSNCVFCSGPFLQDLQGDSFTLATLVFYAPGEQTGVATFGLSPGAAMFSDAFGNPILDVAIQGPVSVTIPEPGSGLLVAMAGLAAALAGRRRRPLRAVALLSTATLLAGGGAATDALAAPPPLACAAQPAPIAFNQHVYCLGERAGTTWDEARAIAALSTLTLDDGTVLKGHLLTINSQAEETFIYSSFRNWVNSDGYGHIWLGAYQFSADVEPAGNWAWVTGEATGNPLTAWSYQALTPGQPGNDDNPVSGSIPDLYNREDAWRMLWYCGGRCGSWDDFHRGDHLNGVGEGGYLLRFIIEFDTLGDNMVHLRAPPAIVSSSLWRSSATLVAGWQNVDFNDAGWAAARAPYPNPQVPSTLMPGTNAAYMWHDPAGQSDGTTGTVSALFRYTFHVDQAATSRPLIGKALISVDDDYDLYVNGQFRNGPRAHDGGNAEVVEPIDFSALLRNGKNVIAIQAVDGAWSTPADRLWERVLFDATVQPQADLLALSSAATGAVVGDGRRYDGRAGAFIGHFGGGCNPRDMAYGPDQKLYVVDDLHPSFGAPCQPAFAVGRFNGKTGHFDEVDDPHALFLSFATEVPAGRLVFGAGGMAFGPDTHLYVSDPAANRIHRYQGPFGPNPGQFMDTFVAGTALTAPRRLRFGPDGSLYVVATSGTATAILRFQGPLGASPGAFVDTFVAAGQGGLAQAADLAFGRDQRLYVANVGPSTAQPSGVLRYEGPAAAAPGNFVNRLVTLTAPPTSLAFGPDGDLYVSNGSTASTGGQVARYDGLSGAAKGSFATTDRAQKILFSAVPNYVTDLGDFNHNGCVDLADMNLLMADVQSTGAHNVALFDLNGDGKVDIADSRKLVLLFNRPGGAACS